MESLLAQIEVWLINLIDKQVEPVIEKRISASFEDETSYITRYINALIDHKIKSSHTTTLEAEFVNAIVDEKFDKNNKQFDGYMGSHEFEADVEEVIDNCIADKISFSFDISNYDSEITDIASSIAQDTLSELDISVYALDIESIVDERISAAHYAVSVTT
jgi:hypothetical protein